MHNVIIRLINYNNIDASDDMASFCGAKYAVMLPRVCRSYDNVIAMARSRSA